MPIAPMCNKAVCPSLALTGEELSHVACPEVLLVDRARGLGQGDGSGVEGVAVPLLRAVPALDLAADAQGS